MRTEIFPKYDFTLLYVKPLFKPLSAVNFSQTVWFEEVLNNAEKQQQSKLPM